MNMGFNTGFNPQFGSHFRVTVERKNSKTTKGNPRDAMDKLCNAVALGVGEQKRSDFVVTEHHSRHFPKRYFVDCGVKMLVGKKFTDIVTFDQFDWFVEPQIQAFLDRQPTNSPFRYQVEKVNDAALRDITDFQFQAEIAETDQYALGGDQPWGTEFYKQRIADIKAEWAKQRHEADEEYRLADEEYRRSQGQ